MVGADLLDTSHSPGGMLPRVQQSGTVPSLSGQSQHTTFYATIFVVGSNGLVYGTSAGNKTPFVGVHTTQLASRCRLLKPQPGTAFHVWLRAENKKPKSSDISPHTFSLPQILFWSEEPEWTYGCGSTPPSATSNYRGILVCISRKIPSCAQTVMLILCKYNHSTTNFRHWFLHGNKI